MAAAKISFANVTNATISEPLTWGSAAKTTLRGEFALSWHLPVPAPGGGTSIDVSD